MEAGAGVESVPLAWVCWSLDSSRVSSGNYRSHGERSTGRLSSSPASPDKGRACSDEGRQRGPMQGFDLGFRGQGMIRNHSPNHMASGCDDPRNGSGCGVWGSVAVSGRAKGLAHAVGRVPSRGGKEAAPPSVSEAEWWRHLAARACWASGWKPLPLSLGLHGGWQRYPAAGRDPASGRDGSATFSPGEGTRPATLAGPFQPHPLGEVADRSHRNSLPWWDGHFLALKPPSTAVFRGKALEVPSLLFPCRSAC